MSLFYLLHLIIQFNLCWGACMGWIYESFTLRSGFLLLSCDFWLLYSGCQTWQQEFLTTELSPGLCNILFLWVKWKRLISVSSDSRFLCFFEVATWAKAGTLVTHFQVDTLQLEQSWFPYLLHSGHEASRETRIWIYAFFRKVPHHSFQSPTTYEGLSLTWMWLQNKVNRNNFYRPF